MNKAILMGRLTKDPEIRTTQSNVSVANFTLACDRGYKSADGTRPTDFIPCVAWRQTADFAHRYFHKGDRMLVEGTIQPRSWEDQEGQRRYITEVIVDQIYFCESKRSDDGQGQGQNDYSSGYSNNYPSAQPRSSGGDGFLPDPDEDETALPFDMT
ncbi:MAG: single-stranded DNA-binding protein [Eubacteriales bacterium]|nr:single-stranded DNA-binding protein [Eubacteriales bacterium]MDD4324720.1 single-stranded DNA-binding protein [Eubacteriales bacterium]MDD4541289.1 single-stranded DNA-binding protein [Eubacteriales bacterium]